MKLLRISPPLFLIKMGRKKESEKVRQREHHHRSSEEGARWSPPKRGSSGEKQTRERRQQTTARHHTHTHTHITTSPHASEAFNQRENMRRREKHGSHIKKKRKERKKLPVIFFNKKADGMDTGLKHDKTRGGEPQTQHAGFMRYLNDTQRERRKRKKEDQSFGGGEDPPNVSGETVLRS